MTMSKPDYNATAVLTEHLGFAPIALIDDVINAVNEIMYKCTAAMETYLQDRQHKRVQRDHEIEPAVPADEIQLGTAKLETLLETEISRNFDKFELYCLRNLFSIPRELLDSGMFRLAHHRGIDFAALKQAAGVLDAEIDATLRDIRHELEMRKLLRLQIARAQKLTAQLQQSRAAFDFLLHPRHEAATQALAALLPLDEHLYYLLDQANELVSLVAMISSKLDQKSHVKLTPRTRYLRGKSYRLLESIGVLETDPLRLESRVNVLLTEQDVEAARELRDALTG